MVELLRTDLDGETPAERRAAAHRWLRAALAARLGADHDALAFAVGPHGKPSLPGSGLAFNLSHSGPTAVLAVVRDERAEVGVDVERLDRRVPIDRAARRAFDASELALAGDPPDQRGLLTLWVVKEALLKATGEGVQAGLASVRVRRGGAPGPAGRGGGWWGEWHTGERAPVAVVATAAVVVAVAVRWAGTAWLLPILDPEAGF